MKLVTRPVTLTLFALILISLAYYLGLATAPLWVAKSEPEASKAVASGLATAAVWTCSMHPQIRLPKPGRCPICGMDLIPAAGGGGESTAVVLGEGAQRIASIEVAPVKRRILEREIRTVGRVEMTEPSVAYLTSRVDGRVEHVFADFTGTTVAKGDHLVEIYAPDLVVAQEEFLVLARRSAPASRPANAPLIDDPWSGQARLVRKKLELLGITDVQIAELERTHEAKAVLTVHAPIGGTVMEKNVREGMYVKTGDPLYTIADLSVVWIFVDVFELDLPWVALGQQVVAEFDAAPGEKFGGVVAFVEPMLNDATRAVRLRVEIENRDRRLRPGMFARVTIRSRLGADGRTPDVVVPGNFVCRMHPSVWSDDAGNCRICGMPLIRRPSMPRPTTERSEILALPVSAILDSGSRRIVYIETSGGTFEATAVQLGPKAGEFYPAIEGVREGDLVVTNGGFLLDSQAQIEGKPSLLFPKGVQAGSPAASTGHLHR